MKTPMDAAHREAHRQAVVPRSSMLSDAAWLAIAGSLDLSKRQIEIIHSVFDDATEYTIGQDLGISLHTVHTHLERIYHKLGVHDRIELVLRVLAEFLRLTADAASGLPPVCGRRAAGECPFQRQAAGM
jgi:DNA-binding NarL/FixJ family response regulator